MKLKQISIFIKKSPGRLYEVTQALEAAGINLKKTAWPIAATTASCGFWSPMWPQPGRIFMKKNFPARVEEVVTIKSADYPGSLAEVFKPLLEANVNITYMYSSIGFSSGKAMVIFRFSDNDKAIPVLQQMGVRLLDTQAFRILEKTVGKPK